MTSPWSTARPIRQDARGYIARAEGMASTVGCVATVLDTSPDESEFESSFGSRLSALAHEPNDAALELEMRQESADAVARCEPRVFVADAAFTREGHTTSGTITLRPKGSRAPLPVPAKVTLRGG